MNANWIIVLLISGFCSLWLFAIIIVIANDISEKKNFKKLEIGSTWVMISEALNPYKPPRETYKVKSKKEFQSRYWVELVKYINGKPVAKGSFRVRELELYYIQID